MKITPKGGYLNTLMRWRENGDRWGAAPPATPSMVREGAAFSLKYQVQKKADYVTDLQWYTHWEFMRNTYDHAYLKQFHLDYLTMKEWEKA